MHFLSSYSDLVQSSHNHYPEANKDRICRGNAPSSIRLSQPVRVYRPKGPVRPISHTNLSSDEILSKNWNPSTVRGRSTGPFIKKMVKAVPK